MAALALLADLSNAVFGGESVEFVLFTWHGVLAGSWSGGQRAAPSGQLFLPPDHLQDKARPKIGFVVICCR